MLDTILASGIVAALVGGCVAWYIATRARVVEYLNARNLQIWGPDGSVQATLTGGTDGACLMFGSRMFLSGQSLHFSSKGVELDQHDATNDEETESVERLRIGVNEDGTAILKFYCAVETPSLGPPLPISELAVTYAGQTSLKLGTLSSLKLFEDDAGLTITLDTWRGRHIRVVSNHETLWESPPEDSGA